MRWNLELATITSFQITRTVQQVMHTAVENVNVRRQLTDTADVSVSWKNYTEYEWKQNEMRAISI